KEAATSLRLIGRVGVACGRCSKSWTPREATMASLPTIVTHPRWVAPPLDRLREGRTRRHHACPICHHDDRQGLALPLDVAELQVWCVRGAAYPGGAPAPRQWGIRSDLWYFVTDAAGTTLEHASTCALPPVWPQVDAGTLHRLLSRVARRFGLSR